MKSKHTKGVWIAKGSERNRSTWVECNGKRICTTKESEQDWYNTILMAAAPLMLDTLQAVYKYALNHPASLDPLRRDMIKEAIKKATETKTSC